MPSSFQQESYLTSSLGQFCYLCAWHPRAAATAAPVFPGSVRPKPECLGPWPPSSSPPQQGEKVRGLPAFLLGWAQLRGMKGWGVSEWVEWARGAGCKPAHQLTHQSSHSSLGGLWLHLATYMGVVSSGTKGEEGDSAAQWGPHQPPGPRPQYFVPTPPASRWPCRHLLTFFTALSLLIG